MFEYRNVIVTSVWQNLKTAEHHDDSRDRLMISLPPPAQNFPTISCKDVTNTRINIKWGIEPSLLPLKTNCVWGSRFVVLSFQFLDYGWSEESKSIFSSSSEACWELWWLSLIRDLFVLSVHCLTVATKFKLNQEFC